METMHSGRNTLAPGRDGDDQAAAEAALAKAPGAGSAIHYYLRRTSVQAAVVGKMGRRSIADRGSGKEKKKKSSSRASRGSAGGGTAGSGINYYLRRASLKGAPWDDGRDGGGAVEVNGGADPGVAGGAVADAMAIAVAAAATAGSGGGVSVSTLGEDTGEGRNTLDHAEVGRSDGSYNGTNVARGTVGVCAGGRDEGEGRGRRGKLPEELEGGGTASSAPLHVRGLEFGCILGRTFLARVAGLDEACAELSEEENGRTVPLYNEL